MAGPPAPPSPEQLFVAGYAACFHSVLKVVTQRQKVRLTGSAVTAEVGIGPKNAGGFGLEVALHVERGGLEQSATEKLIEAAHQVCSYSNATHGNIPVTLKTMVS